MIAWWLLEAAAASECGRRDDLELAALLGRLTAEQVACLAADPSDEARRILLANQWASAPHSAVAGRIALTTQRLWAVTAALADQDPTTGNVRRAERSRRLTCSGAQTWADALIDEGGDPAEAEALFVAAGGRNDVRPRKRCRTDAHR